MIHGKHPEKGQTPRAACMENKTSMKEDTQDTLEKLRRVGFSTFVRYYPQFIDPHCEIADINRSSSVFFEMSVLFLAECQ